MGVSLDLAWSNSSDRPAPKVPPATINFDRATRLRFMRIDERTGETLRQFWKVVEACSSELLQAFYDHVTKQPELARLIGSQFRASSRRKRPIGALVNAGSITSTSWLRAIGRVHDKIGLEPRWYIGGYNLVLGA